MLNVAQGGIAIWLMLQSLDTLIGFVVILLAASLLVTILVQMLSAAFALRGKNLGNAVALTFQSINPEIADEAYALAERILSDPRLSDSTIPRKTVGRRPAAGQQLPWSWWSLFNGLQLTSAIRPQEIYDVLNEIVKPAATVKTGTADPADGDNHTVSAKSDKEIKPSITVTPATTDKNTGKLNSQTAKQKNWFAKNLSHQVPDNRLATLASGILDKLGRSRGMVEAVSKEFSALAALLDNVAEPDKSKLANAVTAAQTSFKEISANFKGEVAELEKWFNAAQDRAEQWFQMHTRIFTIICGIILAFALQLDAIEIFKFVSTECCRAVGPRRERRQIGR